jgi:hypothetical protein
MVVEGITNDISLRQFPIAAAAAQLPAEQVTAPRTIVAVQQDTANQNEDNQQSATTESDTDTEDSLIIEVMSEAELERTENEARLYTILEPVQIDQPSPYTTTVATPKRVIVLGSLVIDVLA